jgi:hypothetical protein
MKPFAILCCAAVLSAGAPVIAQQAGQSGGSAAPSSDKEAEQDGIKDEENRRRFWEAAVPGGHFQVALDKVVSLSMHEYVLDGSVIVTEVTIDTIGQALPRFYYLEPLSNRTSGTGTGAAVAGIVDRGRELIERAGEVTGTDIHNMVHKKYGISTHTKTLEYRLATMEELTALYNSIRKAWDTGQGRRITIR